MGLSPLDLYSNNLSQIYVWKPIHESISVKEVWGMVPQWELKCKNDYKNEIRMRKLQRNFTLYKPNNPMENQLQSYYMSSAKT